MVTSIQSMMQTHPHKVELDPGLLMECIMASSECAATCVSCADACLGEDMVRELVRCIRLNQDCADICTTTMCLLLRQNDPDLSIWASQVKLCADICHSCASECESHAGRHEHCRVCGESCRRCEDTCIGLLEAME